MALKNGRYYQRSIRKGGRVTTEYVGSGPLAVLFAAADKDIAEQHRQLRREARALRAEQQAELDTERARGKTSAAIVAIALNGAGYVRRNRKKWSKKPMTAAAKPAMPAPTEGELRQLMEEVRTKQPGALAKFQDIAESHPALVVEATNSDFQDLCFIGYSHQVCRNKKTGQEGAYAKLRLVVSELVGKSKSPVRRMLAEAVAFAWMEHWLLSLHTAVREPEHQAPIQVMRQNAALRRFLTALKTFAQITALEGKVSGNIFANLFGDDDDDGPAREPPDLCIDGDKVSASIQNPDTNI